MKSIRQILLILVMFLTLYCGILLCQEVDSYSNKTEDTLRIVAKALSTGIMYKQLYEVEVETSRMYDSLYTICKNSPAKTIEVVKKETNWLMVGVGAVAALLLNWTIYLTLNK